MPRKIAASWHLPVTEDYCKGSLAIWTLGQTLVWALLVDEC
jgi:hypothetical protein